MSDHYCCKTCGLRYDDCRCTFARGAGSPGRVPCKQCGSRDHDVCWAEGRHADMEREPTLAAWVEDDDRFKALPNDVFQAGYKFVDEAIKSGADKMDGISPMWYGWALRCAFWSGYEYANNRSDK